MDGGGGQKQSDVSHGNQDTSFASMREVSACGTNEQGQAAIGFEPMHNGFAIRPLSPLGYAAGSPGVGAILPVSAECRATLPAGARAVMEIL